MSCRDPRASHPRPRRYVYAAAVACEMMRIEACGYATLPRAGRKYTGDASEGREIRASLVDKSSECDVRVLDPSEDVLEGGTDEWPILPREARLQAIGIDEGGIHCTTKSTRVHWEKRLVQHSRRYE